MDRDRMLDLPGKEIYTQSQLFEQLKEHTVKQPIVYHITLHQREDDNNILWVGDVAEFPNLGGYEDTPEATLWMVGEAIGWMISNQHLTKSPTVKSPGVSMYGNEEVTTNANCPICEIGVLHHKKGFRERDYKGHRLMTPFSYSECDSCLSEIADKEQILANSISTKHKGWTDYGI